MNEYALARSGEARPCGTALAKAGTGIADPLLAFAASESGQDVLGKLLRFSKGDYIADKEEIARGTECLAAVDALVVGYQRWAGKAVVERVMGRIADGFREPERSERRHGAGAA